MSMDDWMESLIKNELLATAANDQKVAVLREYWEQCSPEAKVRLGSYLDAAAALEPSDPDKSCLLASDIGCSNEMLLGVTVYIHGPDGRDIKINPAVASEAVTLWNQGELFAPTPLITRD